jgi:hypothetical protein
LSHLFAVSENGNLYCFEVIKIIEGVDYNWAKLNPQKYHNNKMRQASYNMRGFSTHDSLCIINRSIITVSNFHFIICNYCKQKASKKIEDLKRKCFNSLKYNTIVLNKRMNKMDRKIGFMGRQNQEEFKVFCKQMEEQLEERKLEEKKIRQLRDKKAAKLNERYNVILQEKQKELGLN